MSRLDGFEDDMPEISRLERMVASGVFFVLLGLAATAVVATSSFLIWACSYL